MQFIVPAVFVCGSQALAVDGPSFDCSHGVRQTLAVILCTIPEAAQADWDISSAYWALYTDDGEQSSFNQAVNERCTLPILETQQDRAGRIFIQELSRRMLGPIPPIPTPQPVTEQHVRCVINAFHSRAQFLRSKLSGDALIESKLSPEVHIEIQVALDRKGFMQNRVRRYGVSADGNFGPNTRSAIKDFQRSTGVEATGFLSKEQRISLLESPEEREARAVRIAAEEKAKQDAIEVRAARIAAQERARQEELEVQKRAEEQAKQAAIEREKKRLEDEVAKAAEWRRKVEAAQKKGAEYASANDLNWSLQEQTNPMTDDKDYTVSSTQTNGTGALAEVDGLCTKNQVLFEGTLHDAADKTVPLGFVNSSAGGIVGRKRMNDEAAFATNFPRDSWMNRIVLSRLSFREDGDESADTTWRILAEIETSKGTLYIKIPTWDPKIQKLIAACKRQYEIEKRRQQPANAPG